MLTSILNFREILQTLGQSITRPLPDPMEFIIMDAFLVILLLYVFLIIRKIVRLLIRLVKRPGVEEKVEEPRIISRRTAENAQSKAEAAKALLAASKEKKNPFKLLGRLFCGIFGKLARMFKWSFRQSLNIVGILRELIRRKKNDSPVATPEAAQPNQPTAAPTYEPVAEPPPGGVVAPISVAAETATLTQDNPSGPIPVAPIPAAPLPQTPVIETPSLAEQQFVPPQPVVPPAPPAAPSVTPATASPVVPPPNVDAPVRASDLMPKPAVPEPGSVVATTTDETTLTAAFEQELRDAQQAEAQLHELKVRAAATALQKGSLAATRSVDEALPWYEKAAELDPGSATAQLGLSRLYKETGNLLGAFEAAQKAFAGTDDQQTQSLALEGMDQVIVAKSDEPTVLEPVVPETFASEPGPRSFEEIRRLLDADPDNPGLQRDLSIAYDEIGDQHAEQDNLIAALECFEASMMVVGRLAKANPDTIDYLRDFSVCNEKIGEVQNALGNRPAAIAAYEESLPIVTMLANRFPEEEEYLFDLKITKDRLAELKTQA
jgi:tetratricopeptide (TPR) repeat protein